MDKDDIIHDRIIAFIEKYNIHQGPNKYDSYYHCIKKAKPSEMKEMEKMVEMKMTYNYNIGICKFICRYLIFFHKNEKGIFCQLVIYILNNNYANIEYDFTIEIIKDSSFHGTKITKLLKNYNLLSYLGRIHPTKIEFKQKIQVETAYYMYNEMCDLQTSWIGAVIKAGVLL